MKHTLLLACLAGIGLSAPLTNEPNSKRPYFNAPAHGLGCLGIVADERCAGTESWCSGYMRRFDFEDKIDHYGSRDACIAQRNTVPEPEPTPTIPQKRPWIEVSEIYRKEHCNKGGIITEADCGTQVWCSVHGSGLQYERAGFVSRDGCFAGHEPRPQ